MGTYTNTSIVCVVTLTGLSLENDIERFLVKIFMFSNLRVTLERRLFHLNILPRKYAFSCACVCTCARFYFI